MTPGLSRKREPTEAPAPAIRIATAPLGYHPASSFYVLERLSSSSLDFVDANHMLFTFRVPELLKRLPECGPEDRDQLIRALLVHLPDGVVERSTDWRMHDRGRYLWPLPEGRFLVRRADELFVTDSSLQLRPFLKPSSSIVQVKLSPGAKLLLVGTAQEKHSEEEHRRLADAAAAAGMSPPREDVRLSIFRVDNGKQIAESRVRNPIDLPLLMQGYLEALPAKGDHWMVRYVTFGGEATAIADVASSCRPSEMPVNGDTAFVDTCERGGGSHIFQAFSLEGKRLWTYRRDNHFIWPESITSEDGRRMALSTLRVSHPVSASDPIDETELQAQRVEIFDVQSGRLALTEYASPLLSGGQNFALSPDGNRFAILRDDAIEIYDLPQTGATALSAGAD